MCGLPSQELQLEEGVVSLKWVLLIAYNIGYDDCMSR